MLGSAAALQILPVWPLSLSVMEQWTVKMRVMNMHSATKVIISLTSDFGGTIKNPNAKKIIML